MAGNTKNTIGGIWQVIQKGEQRRNMAGNTKKGEQRRNMAGNTKKHRRYMASNTKEESKGGIW